MNIILEVLPKASITTMASKDIVSGDDEYQLDGEEKEEDNSESGEEDHNKATGTDERLQAVCSKALTVSSRRYPSRKWQPVHRFVANNASSRSCHQTGNDEANKCFISATPCYSGKNQRLKDDDNPAQTAAMNSSVPVLRESAPAKKWEALRETGIWVEVSLSHGVRAFPSKFMPSVKRILDWSVEPYKACLVLLGHFQRPKIDYNETYAPVVDFSVVRVNLSIASDEDHTVHQLDLKSAFLKGFVNEYVYEAILKGYVNNNGNMYSNSCKVYIG